MAQGCLFVPIPALFSVLVAHLITFPFLFILFSLKMIFWGSELLWSEKMGFPPTRPEQTPPVVIIAPQLRRSENFRNITAFVALEPLIPGHHAHS